MKRIRKNATKKIREILLNDKIFAYSGKNDYKGAFITLSEKDIRMTIEDIRDEHAHLYERQDGKHLLQYAAPCRWIIG